MTAAYVSNSNTFYQAGLPYIGTHTHMYKNTAAVTRTMYEFEKDHDWWLKRAYVWINKAVVNVGIDTRLHRSMTIIKANDDDEM